MKVAVLIVSRNRPDLVRAQVEWLGRNASLAHDVYAVEASNDDDKLCEHSTVRYADEDFRGKAFAHNVALEEARRAAAECGERYDYHGILMNDVVFEEGVDAMQILVEQMEAEPRLGILSPTCEDRTYPGSARQRGGGWRPVTTCDYLGFVIRGDVVETIGFLKPDFRYCWGAIHELSFLLHSQGYCVGYSDAVEYRHLGGTTYGAAGTRTIPRDEHQRRAKRFAFTYFNQVYGPDWARVFWERAKPFGATIDTYREHEAYWMTALTPDEARSIKEASRRALPAAANSAAGARPTLAHRLHRGCGPDKREGWVNVDVNPRFAPDLVAPAHALPMLENESCSAIEACHLFEHLTPTEAKKALREWRRLLGPGGELHLELPNLERCIALIGTDLDGFDLGMISLFGYPPEVDEQGAPQLHKWGWTPRTLRAAMLEAGFDAVDEVPVTQTTRKAARFDRDMRLVARVAVPAEIAAARHVPVTTEAGAPEDEAQMTRVLAWPRYDDEAGLERFFHVFARVLEGREDVCLFLRVDPDRDPSQDEVVAALERAHARTLGTEALLNINLLQGPISDAEWREMGPMLACRIRSAPEVAPRDAARQVPTPIAGDAASLYALLNDARCGRGTHASSDDPLEERPEASVIVPAGAPCDPALAKEIAALQPWFYPVTIDGLTVVPGLGSVCEPEWLASRAAHRAQLLVGEVLRQVDMRGKSVLDLACNCAFWSSHYAEAGAATVFGVEGRPRHVEQAKLYWDREKFLPKGKYDFRVGNIAERSAWPMIEERGPFDVTLCAGILYHVPNYAEILEWAASVTREVLIVDTRVQDGEEVLITEPGDLTFNAIRETRDKIVPDRRKLLATLERLGFETEVPRPTFGSALGVDDVDRYALGNRVTIIARKVAVPAGSGSSLNRSSAL